MAVTHAPPTHVHRPHVNPWLVAVIVLGAALVGLGAWVLVDSMSGTEADDATALIDRVDTAFTTGDMEAIPSLYTSDAVVESVTGETITGVEAIRTLAAGTFQAERIAPVTTEGDLATTFTRLTAGDQVTTAVSVYQIRDGKIARQWGFVPGETPPLDNALP